ncbi:MAG TPA: D-alanyl-D-alanine carboxypeptidase/D-alanyl-D-alanine-endopeptidase [Gemmatimonadota bacterium]|nr:D-alanyl-D-alanine carboxypeptidase/D-alanyl-D-alanine-endopeptidase [Gemmatimonadota bacterium]
MRTARIAVGLLLLTTWTSPLTGQGSSDVEPAYRATPGAISRLLDPLVHARGGDLGVAVYSVERNQALYLHNADWGLVPASNMKLFTTAAALDRLGPDFQYTTSVYGDGAILEDGSLIGDLVLVGRGDPTISGRFFGDSATYVYDRLAQELREKGVRRVRGRLIGDASYFDDVRIASGWETSNLLWWYGARPSALSFNDNVVTIEVRPGGWVGAPASISFDPFTDGIPVENRVVTTRARGGRSIGIRRASDIGGYEIFGRISIVSGPLRYVVSVEDPAEYALSVFRARLERRGIEVEGPSSVVHNWNRQSLRAPRLLASHTSPRMIEIVRVINKLSQNFFAEQVLKTLGAVFESEGSFDEGADVVRDVLEDFDLPTHNLRIYDGSGLSRRNTVTAQLTAELLVAMHDHPRFEEYYESLLIAGTDGDTRRLDTPAARGNVHSKTGTLRGVSALSGYVTTGDGELLAFSVLSNGTPRGKWGAVSVEDAIAERLADYSVWSPPLLQGSTGR